MNFSQKAQITLVLLFASACGALTGCSPQAKSPKKDLVECYAAVIKPVVGEVFDEVELAHDLVSGKASLSAVLSNLNVAEADVKRVLKGLHDCAAPPPPAALPEGVTL